MATQSMTTQIFIVKGRGFPDQTVTATPEYRVMRNGGTRYIAGRDIAKSIVGHSLVASGHAATFFEAVNLIKSCVVAPGQRRPYPAGVKRPRRYGKDTMARDLLKGVI